MEQNVTGRGDPLLIVIGPTGSGKSALAMQLAHAFRGEIVNCDSLQLYKHLDIGTAKPTIEERRQVPHWLVDILEPQQVFTAGEYMRAGRAVLDEITSRRKLPVIAGGTGFYLRALLEGLDTGPARNDALRERLAARPERLHRLLTRFDPASAARIHPNDTQKLIRAVEFCILARRPMSDSFTPGRDRLRGYRACKLGLIPDRKELNLRLEQRCREMFQRGLIEEVQQVLDRGVPADAKALEAIGYREAVLYLNGEITREQAVEQTIIATRQYAKRQGTWFRREPGVRWIRGFGNQQETIEEAIRLAREFIFMG